MAANAPADEDEIIKCSICFEIFNIPKYLPCLHTFCQSCLDTYITSALKRCDSNKGSEKEFHCPICRTLVPTPKATSSSSELAERFPTNHLMVTLIDQSKLKSKSKLCDPCFVNGEKTIATSWCSDCNEALCNNCEKSHKAMKALRNHDTIVLETIKPESTFITTLDYCEDHRDKKLEFYCVDHEIPCCSSCVTVNHRKCEHVKTLQEAARGCRENSDLSGLCEVFKDMSSFLESVINERLNNLKDLETEKTKVQTAFSELRLDIIQHIDNLEAKLNEQLTSVHKEVTTEMKDDIAGLENSKKIIDNCQSVANACDKHASEVHIFLELKKLQKRRKEQQKYLQSKLNTLQKTCYEIEFEKELLNFKQRVLSPGKLSTKNKEMTCKSLATNCKWLSVENLKDCVAEEISSFQISGAKYLVGGIFLTDDRLLLSDCNNKRLVVCDNTGKVHKDIPVHDYPWDIAMLDRQQAAVTLQTTCAVQYVDIVNFTAGRQVKVEGVYRGLAFDGIHLIVGCRDTIALIEKDGKIIRRLQKQPTIEYCAVNNDKILYSCDTLYCCMTLDGNTLFAYSHNDLKSCQGICCDRDGNIYVAGYSSNNIHQLDAKGNLIKILLTANDGISKPRAINFQPGSDCFFVTYGPDNVKIFKLRRK